MLAILHGKSDMRVKGELKEICMLILKVQLDDKEHNAVNASD